MNSGLVEVVFERHTFGGECLARLADGRAIFVPFVLPGERAEVEILSQKRGFARGRLVRLLEASPRRVTPRCAHFGVCGGCHYQHLNEEEHPRLREELLRDQLQRIGGFSDPPLRPTLSSPSAWNYRNALQFHLDREGKPGFMPQFGHEVMTVTECWLPLPALAAAWPQLEFEPQAVDRFALRAGSDAEVLLTIEGASLPDLSVEEEGFNAVSLGEDGSAVVLAGDGWTLHQVQDLTFRASAGSFFQSNAEGCALLVDTVLAALEPHPGETILDLYCGVGLFSAFLARRGCRVIGLEVSPAACEDYAVNLDPYEEVSLYQGSAEEVLPHLEIRPDKVVLDPPRAGLDPRALAALLRLQPQRIVYVSCDPSTLARDLKRMAAEGWQLLSAQPLDLFPQTAHMETVAVLEPRIGGDS